MKIPKTKRIIDRNNNFGQLFVTELNNGTYRITAHFNDHILEYTVCSYEFLEKSFRKIYRSFRKNKRNDY